MCVASRRADGGWCALQHEVHAEAANAWAATLLAALKPEESVVVLDAQPAHTLFTDAADPPSPPLLLKLETTAHQAAGLGKSTQRAPAPNHVSGAAAALLTRCVRTPQPHATQTKQENDVLPPCLARAPAPPLPPLLLLLLSFVSCPLSFFFPVAASSGELSPRTESIDVWLPRVTACPQLRVSPGCGSCLPLAAGHAGCIARYVQSFRSRRRSGARRRAGQPR